MRLPLGLIFASLILHAADGPTPVILISVDTLRADHLSLYGAPQQTPNIDTWARQGTVFTGIESQIPLTLPSHTSLFTSTYPFQNRIEENAERVPAGAVTLASVLHGRGYKTAAFVGSVLLDRRLGLDQGFDFYDSPFNPPNGTAENPYGVRVRRDGALVIRAARQWLDAQRGQSVFAFLHFFDLHAPYSAGGSAGPLPSEAGYDAEVQYIDQLLGRFQQALAQSGWWDRSLVILLADHGESLGEHGETSHGYFVYQSTLWVPLIVHWPAGVHQPERIAEAGGLIDVAPTVLDFLKVPKPPSFVGESLLSSHHRPVLSESVYARDAFRWAALRTARLGDLQYIAAPKPELYNLREDPLERRNLLPQQASLAQPLSSQLADLLARYAPARTVAAAAVSAETRALLGSLGYVGAGPRNGGTSGAPDPKDRLPEYELHEKAMTALYTGDPQMAIAEFRQVLARDSRNIMDRYYLGEAYMRARKPDDARREWTAVLSAEPGYTAAGESIGALWMGRQDYAKARAAFRQVLASDPDDSVALFEEGIAEEHLGLMKDAREHVEAACRMEPDSATCQRELLKLK